MPVTKIIHDCPYRGATTTCHTPSDGLTQSNEARYAIGYEQPNYPVPAIPLQVRWIGDISNPFYGLEIRDNNQWANMTWSPDYGLEYRPREHWQCEFCGCIHPGEPCPY
jgi:hypothetical protein